MRRSFTLVTVSILVSSLAWAGCDGFSEFVEDPLGDFAVQLRIPDARFALDGLSVPVAPDRSLAFSSTERPDFGTTIDELISVTLDPSQVSFVPFFDGATPSGSFAFYGFIDGVPLPNSPITVTVTDGAVSDLTPLQATADSQIDLARVTAVARDNEIGIPADLATLTGRDLLERIRVSLSQPETEVAVVTEPIDGGTQTEPLLGRVTIREVRVDVLVTPSALE